MSVTIERDELRIRFEKPWTLDKHALFIRTKKLPESLIEYRWEDDSYTLRAPARFAGLIGLDIGPRDQAAALPISDFLFGYQKWIVEMALTAKRYAIWADCGLGKTPMQLEWARHVIRRTGGRTLIMAPLEVCRQTMDEADRFYGRRPTFLKTRADLAAFCKGEPIEEATWPNLAVTNYQKMIGGVLPEMRWLCGLALDESSILKSGGGVIKWNLIKSAKGIEYKSSWTATPAPNDTMEYASQASFLEKLRSEGEILWTFFARDKKTQIWRVKPHAEEAFYRFMAGWSIYLRKPSAYGFEDPFADVPEPEIIEIKVPVTPEQARLAHQYHRSYDPESLIPQERLSMTQRSKLSQLAKGFIYAEKRKGSTHVRSNKPAVVASLVRDGLRDGKQCLVWSVFDEESEILSEHLAGTEGIATLHGKHKEDERVDTLDAFRRGEVRCLISKAALLGHGLNFQFCTRMIFSGFDDSFERFYQAVRRCYRYGSREQLKVFVPYVPSLENHVWENVLRKKGRWELDTARQEEHYRQAINALK